MASSTSLLQSTFQTARTERNTSAHAARPAAPGVAAVATTHCHRRRCASAAGGWLRQAPLLACTHAQHAVRAAAAEQKNPAASPASAGRNILVAVDGSEDSQHALQWTVRELYTPGACDGQCVCGALQASCLPVTTNGVEWWQPCTHSVLLSTTWEEPRCAAPAGDVIHVAHCIPYLPASAGLYAFPGAPESLGSAGRTCRCFPALKTSAFPALRPLSASHRWPPPKQPSHWWPLQMPAWRW
jgi:hypothetical protein